MNYQRVHFRQIKVGGRTLDPLFEWECRYCGKRFPFEDRTGRENYLGLNSHIAMHVRKRELERKS
jgi:hypothetical protein